MSNRGCAVQDTPNVEERPITILLPWYLDPVFSDLFQEFGFRVLWAESREELARALGGEHIDIAFEWQHGPEDFPVRDLLRSRRIEVPIVLCLNWNGRLPGDPTALGYACWLKVPFEIEPMMRVLLWLLPKSRQPLMRELMVHVVGEVGVPAQPEGRG